MRYRFDVTCPRCGGDAEHVAGGSSSTWETRAVMRCATCDAQFVIVLALASAVEPRLDGTVRPPVEHGTERGYQQHRHRPNDPACDACLEAHRIHNKPSRDRWRARQKVSA